MKKIIILVLTILMISSCGINNKEKEIVEKPIKKQEIKTIYLDPGTIEKIKKNDIRKKTEYVGELKLADNSYHDNPKNISILINYIQDLEYQGVLENKQKEYTNIIVMIGTDFIKQIEENKIELKGLDKSLLFPRLLKIIGDNFKILGDTNKAILAYEQSIKEDESYYESYIDLEKIYKKLGEEDKAGEYFTKAKEIIEKEKIIETLNKNIEKYKEIDFLSYLKLGIIYKFLGEEDKALEYFTKANKITETHPFLSKNEYYKNMTKSKITQIIK